MEPHIYCIEGHWNHDLGATSQVEGMLKSNRENEGMPYIRRNCATLDEMHFWLAREWAELPRGSILYIASHGAPGQIWLSKRHPGSRPQVEAIATLPDTSTADSRSWEGCLVHFSGCETVKMPPEDLDEFMNRSGASVVSGFTKEAGFLSGDGAALPLEIEFFNSIGPKAGLELHLLSGNNDAARDRRQRLRKLERKLQKQHPDCGFQLRLSPDVRAHD